jgi:cysteinyl-tRNA synthetase
MQLMGLMGGLIPLWMAEEAFDLGDYEAYLSDARVTAMESKDFSHVDAIKAMLTNAGVQVQMSKDGVILTPTADFDAGKLEAVL